VSNTDNAPDVDPVTDDGPENEPDVADDATAAEAQTRFASLPEFVTEFLLQVWRRELRSGCWCDHWWEHPEAVLRLEATWDAFEALRLEPGTGVSVWIRDHLDYHMGVLTSRETSPFYLCDVEKQRHNTQKTWRSVPAPAGLFSDVHADPEKSSGALDWEN